MKKSRFFVTSGVFLGFLISRHGDDQDGQNDPVGPVTNVDHLNRVDLQAIFEFLSTQEPLPPNLTEAWVRANFMAYEGRLHRVDRTTNRINLSRVPEHATLVAVAEAAHLAAGQPRSPGPCPLA
ncbi:hypothetical protein CDD82_1386 [Ophiocordyceps australis]|uniref:Uncharacterized protein n=1 Tax=Ophiocordyceps australis TaxID=1399860 RepID=A0A2C5ZGD0_9HYPO|nr:hypothetical protein CDD82_1386 [Ophiocordyceps australis]